MTNHILDIQQNRALRKYTMKLIHWIRWSRCTPSTHWAVKEQWHSVWLSAYSMCQTITTESSPVWSDRGDIEGTVHDGESLCLWLHQLIQSATTRPFCGVSSQMWVSSLYLYIFFKIYRILALTLKGKLDTPTTLEIPDPMSTLGLQDNI